MIYIVSTYRMLDYSHKLIKAKILASKKFTMILWKKIKSWKSKNIEELILVIML